MNKAGIAGTVAAVTVSAVFGIATGIMLYHGPASPQPAQRPAAAVQQLDDTTPPATNTPLEAVTVSTPDQPAVVATPSEVTTESQVIVIVGPPPSRMDNGEMHAAMPTGPTPTTTNDVATPIRTPEMPPGYPTSPQETPQETPAN